MNGALDWGGHRQARRIESLGTQQKVRLLLAEDDDAFRGLLSAQLRKAGAKVFEVYDGSQLLELLGALTIDRWPSEPVDAIISDIRMPGMGGLDVVRELRHRGWEIPVVLMTAFSDSETRKAASAMNASLIDKPFETDELLTAVAAAMDR